MANEQTAIIKCTSCSKDIGNDEVALIRNGIHCSQCCMVNWDIDIRAEKLGIEIGVEKREQPEDKWIKVPYTKAKKQDIAPLPNRNFKIELNNKKVWVTPQLLNGTTVTAIMLGKNDSQFARGDTIEIDITCIITIVGINKIQLQEIKDKILSAEQPEYFDVDAEKNWLSAEQGNVSKESSGIAVHRMGTMSI